MQPLRWRFPKLGLPQIIQVIRPGLSIETTMLIWGILNDWRNPHILLVYLHWCCSTSIKKQNSIYGLSYIPICSHDFIVDLPFFSWDCPKKIFPHGISQHSPRPGRRRSKGLLDVEEFLSHLDSMLSNQQWIQMQSPALTQLVLHDPRFFFSKRGRLVVTQKRGRHQMGEPNLGKNDEKCIPADLKWRFRAIEPKFFLVLIFSMYTWFINRLNFKTWVWVFVHVNKSRSTSDITGVWNTTWFTWQSRNGFVVCVPSFCLLLAGIVSFCISGKTGPSLRLRVQDPAKNCMVQQNDTLWWTNSLQLKMAIYSGFSH